MEAIVNGRKMQIKDADSAKRLLDFIREDLDLTGTKDGCSVGACGSCTVLIDHKPVRSCLKKVADIDGKELLTIEGLEGKDGALHPVQQAFMDCGAVQCGFCTPGMVLTGYALLLRNPKPTREEIRKAIRPNLCRCTGYQKIVDAISRASAVMAGKNE